MKKYTVALLVSAMALTCSVYAQPGAHSGGPQFSGSMAKLFGENPAFSATMEVQIAASGQNMTLPGKIFVDSGKSRFESNLGDIKGGNIPQGSIEHMKTMGMDKSVTISRPDKKISYIVYPGLSAYAEMPMQDPDATKPESAFKSETTELGKETVDGHPCIKNKVVITDDEGKKHEATVWNATDLKKFPVKIELAEQGHPTTMLFKEVKLAKPDAALFEAPADFKKYDNMQQMMQAEMMKRMGGMQLPPGHPMPHANE
jgi:hypothetical protein